MLDEHKIHASLLRPPLTFGVERKLFFLATSLGTPIFTYGGFNLRSGVALVLYGAVAYFVCTRVTARDTNYLDLVSSNLKYRDHYPPHPQPGRKPRPPANSPKR